MNPRQIWTAYLTLVSKELIRVFRIWPQTLMPPAITMALYFLIFGRLIGSQIHPVQHVAYMQYIVPGLIMMTVITNSYIHTSTSFFIAKFQRSIEEILVSPMPNAIILLGYLTAALIRVLIVALIVVFIAAFFTHLSVSHFGLMILTVILTSIFFATAGLINAIFAKNFDDISWIPSFVLTPLTYLGGVFFSIDMLSGIWKKIAILNPILYIVDLFRYSVLNIQDTPIAGAFIFLCVIAAGLFLWAWVLLGRSGRLRS